MEENSKEESSLIELQSMNQQNEDGTNEDKSFDETENQNLLQEIVTDGMLYWDFMS